MASNSLDLSKSISGSGLTPEEKKKLKQQNAFQKLIVQIKDGCNKQICFNHFCRKNIFSKWERNQSFFFQVESCLLSQTIVNLLISLWPKFQKLMTLTLLFVLKVQHLRAIV